jgi:hypothetical protein
MYAFLFVMAMMIPAIMIFIGCGGQSIRLSRLTRYTVIEHPGQRKLKKHGTLPMPIMLKFGCALEPCSF